MLEVLDLTKVACNIEGNNDLPGISGGQHRRLTSGEMLMNYKAKISCLDNATNGLASTDGIQLMKFITRTFKTKSASVMAMLQQSSDEIAHSFDELLVTSLSEKHPRGTRSNKSRRHYFR